MKDLIKDIKELYLSRIKVDVFGNIYMNKKYVKHIEKSLKINNKNV